MHQYYKDKAPKLKKFMTETFSYIAADIENEFHKPFDEVIEEVWQFYYEEILKVLPYIGGDSVSGTFNLTGATLQIALAEVGKQYGMSIETWGKLMVKSTELYFKNHFFKSLSMKIVLKYPKLANMAMKKSAQKNRKNALENPGSFETEVIEPTEEYPIIMHNTVCPIYNFAKEYGYMDYMPYLCNLDYVLFKSVGAALYREKTCADGDEYCDFKFKKNAPIPSVWPPHVLDENDPLK